MIFIHIIIGQKLGKTEVFARFLESLHIEQLLTIWGCLTWSAYIFIIGSLTLIL